MSSTDVEDRLRVAGLLWVAERVAMETGVPLHDILGRSRRARASRARRRLYVALRRHPSKPSLLEIGAMLGRDHTTILMGLRVACGEEHGESAEEARRKAEAMERYDVALEQECL